MERVEYQGWRNCFRLATGLVDLIITGDVGPRIIRLGFVGAENEFKEFDRMLGLTGGDEWRIYGGHRLWHAPEVMPRTYFPDNHPVDVRDHGDFVRVTAPTETTTGIQKELDLRLDDRTAHVHIVHRLRNMGPWPIELAPWALSVMAPGGVAIIPLPQEDEGLLPSSVVSIWPYTRMSDPRWVWGDRYILLSQTPGASTRQKTGIHATSGWAAYARNDHLFVKRFHYQPSASYPDFGCTVETYTDGEMLELETLAPLARIAPGDSVEHTEDWYLLRDVPPVRTEGDVVEHVEPLVATLN